MHELLRCLIVIALNIFTEAEKGDSETRIYCLLIRGNHANLKQINEIEFRWLKHYSKSRKKDNLFEAIEQAKCNIKQNLSFQQHNLKVKKLGQVRIEQRWITLPFNTIIPSCGITFSLLDPAKIWPDPRIV